MDAENRKREIRSYRDLIAWQKAMTLAEAVYIATRSFPKEEIYGLTSQMRRAAVSVVSNIAEGHCRKSRGEFLQFVGHARGSLAELETQIILAGRLELLDPDHEQTTTALTVEVGRLLNGLRRSLSPPTPPSDL
jgi:four helix bundle protein